MFYFFYNCISPNTASGNRCLSFLKGFDELGVEATFVTLIPHRSHYRLNETFRHVKIEYLWHDFPIANRLFNRLMCPWVVGKFVNQLKDGDIVFCYGSPSYVPLFLTKKGIRVFHERTESPEVLPLSNEKKQKEYLEACKQLDGLFVISTALRNFFIQKGVPSEKIKIINMTVDSNRFVWVRKNDSTERYIAYCGTASNNKDGVDELLKAFAIVAKKHKDVKLYIIGKTPSSEEKVGNLKLIEYLNIKDKVVFTGVVDSSQMPQLLKDATVLALDRPDSLQAQNGFPTKLGEYLLSENPVVVTRVGDIPLFLRDGESALLAEQRNSEDFASKLCWALEHPLEAAVIGRNGKEVALREFNYLTETKKIIDTIYG